ncbi:discoidin domain-containing protein, partial [Spirochaetota bacterium]
NKKRIIHFFFVAVAFFVIGCVLFASDTGSKKAAKKKKALLKSDNWVLVSCDSQETEAQDGKAENAFDNDPETFWHTQWHGVEPEQPHEIVIDLGKKFNIIGIRYTTRTQEHMNGTIKKFEFYIGNNPDKLREPVIEGEFNIEEPGGNEIVYFAQTLGQYIKLRSITDKNDQGHTCVPELDVIVRVK